MFGRTILCIYTDQLEDNPRLTTHNYRKTETYSDEDEYDTDPTQTESKTESENEQQNEPRNKTKNQSQNQKPSKEHIPEESKHKNVTHRKQKQNTDNQQYIMQNSHPEPNNDSYPPISNSNIKQQTHKRKTFKQKNQHKNQQ